MKGLRPVRLLLPALVLLGSVRSSPLPDGDEQRGVGIGIGFPSFFHDIKHQFGSITHDLRKLVTSLMGATQVVYWKPPFKRQPPRRMDQSHRLQTLGRHPRPTVTTGHPPRRSRRKKAYTGNDYDDFFSLDSLGFW